MVDAKKLIENYQQLEPQESDYSAREVAAARLYWTGDKENMRVANAIWKLLGTSVEMINTYIRSQPKS